MKITDFVKPGMMNKAHIEAAEKMLAPRESVMYAFTANCRTVHGATNRLIVLTGHRLLFVVGIVKPPQCDAFSLGSCIGIGDITGGLISKQDYVCDDQRITVEASKDRLQALTEKTLAAIEAYPNQPALEFPAKPVAGPAVAPASRNTPQRRSVAVPASKKNRPNSELQRTKHQVWPAVRNVGRRHFPPIRRASASEKRLPEPLSLGLWAWLEEHSAPISWRSPA